MSLEFNSIEFEDVIDSRDVISLIDGLEDELNDLEVELVDAEESLAELLEEFEEADAITLSGGERQFAIEHGIHTINEDIAAIAEPVRVLREFADEAEGYAPDWFSGETLIRDSYFTKYAMQLAEDNGAVSDDHSWPNDCIDWDKAALELQIDYSAVTLKDVTYWIR